ARYAPGRWHTPDHPVIYASEHYSTAMLEKLIHAAGMMPPNQHWIRITLPRYLSYEVVTPAFVAGWDSNPPITSREYGKKWAQEKCTTVFSSPPTAARMEYNVLISPLRPEFGDIEPDALASPIWWNERLYQQA